MTARAVVGFRDGEYLCSRLFPPYLRHVCVAVPDGDMWVAVDHQSHVTIAQCSASSDDFFADWPLVISCLIGDAKTYDMPILRPQTCVETAKRLLKIRDRLIFTPPQLYSHLMRCRDGRIIRWRA